MQRMGQVRTVGLLLIGALVGVGCNGGGVKGAAGGLVATPSLLNYGPVALNDERRIEVTVSNEGRGPFVVSDLFPTVANLRVEGMDGPFTLGTGESRKFTAVFTPAVEGSVTGAITVKTDDSGERNLQVFGVGVKATVEISPQALDFGEVDINTTSMQELTVHNPTGVPATVSMTVLGENASEFSSTMFASPLLVNAGETTKVPVAFSPIMLGVRSARLMAKVCDACEPIAVDLTGDSRASVVSVDPMPLDFGRVSVGGTAQQKISITNNGNDPIRWVGAPFVTGTGSAAYELVGTTPTTNDEIAPGQRVELYVAFKPNTTGSFDLPTLKLPIRATRVPTDVTVGLRGEGGGSCVAVNPNVLAFGTVPQGMSVTRHVDVINRCSGAVTLSDIKLTGVTGGYLTLGQAAATFNVPVGGAVPVKVTYTPKPNSTASTANLEVSAYEGTSLSTLTVPVTANTRPFAPCQFTVTPPSLDYGLVSVGAEVTLGFGIRNGGTDDCVVTGMELAAGSDPEFSATPVDMVTLAPGEGTTLPVKFKPSAVGSFSAMAEAWVNNQTNGHISVNLTGQGVTGCFTLQPTTIDFGTKKLSCGPRTRNVVAFNNCTAPVTITQAQLAQGTSNEYSLYNPPTLPLTLNPGAVQNFAINYVAVDDGQDLAAFQVNAGQGGYQTAGIIGAGLSREDNIDVFQQESQTKVDVLFVLDNSGSMMEEQQSLGDNFQAFLNAAQIQGIDYHIGVTTTGIEPSPGGWSVCPGGAEGGEHGRLFPADNSSPRIITPSTPNAASVFKTNTNVGWCHWNEQGLEGAYRALTTPLVNNTDDPTTTMPNDGNAGFLRQDAKLAIIFLSDEDDSSQQTVSYYETFFKAVKANDPTMLSISAIVGPTNLGSCPTASSTGTRYIQLADDTGGLVESICTQNWAGSLQNLSNNAFGPKRHFGLSEIPADPSQIVVKVNGSPVTTGWTYDAATNTVVFDTNAVPAPGATVEVTYPLGC